MCREGFIVGGFASAKWYYKPLQWWLTDEGFSVDFIHPAPRFDLLGLNVWPLEVFLSNAVPAIEKMPGEVFLVGHSLGGIQSILLAVGLTRPFLPIALIWSRKLATSAKRWMS